MKLNLPNKLTIFRIVLAFIIIVLLIFPFHTIDIAFPKYLINGIYADSKYFIAGILFVIASVTDFLDGYIARKYNLVTDFGKVADSIADKVLVNSVLIILAAQGFIPPLIAVVVVVRDNITNAIKTIAGNKGEVVSASIMGKVKATCLMVGIILTLFYNMPFEIYNLRVADFLLVLAAVLAVISGIQYYRVNKKYFVNKD